MRPWTVSSPGATESIIRNDFYRNVQTPGDVEAALRRHWARQPTNELAATWRDELSATGGHGESIKTIAVFVPPV
jgi:hypothetical protein